MTVPLNIHLQECFFTQELIKCNLMKQASKSLTITWSFLQRVRRTENVFYKQMKFHFQLRCSYFTPTIYLMVAYQDEAGTRWGEFLHQLKFNV